MSNGARVSVGSHAGVFPAVILSFALLLVWFWSPLSVVASFWAQDEYSHAPLVAIVSALIAWQRVVTLRPPPAPSWSGLLLLALAALLFIVGQLAAFSSASAYGFIPALAGLCLCFFGWAYLRACAPALILLLFTVPLPQILVVGLTADLQLLSSTLGVRMLDAIGLPVFQEGNLIDLGTLKLQIVEACSGLRYLFPLMSCSYLAAYLVEDVWWKKGVLFLSAIPITIVLNSLRIALTGVAADRWGVEAAQGFIHEFEGWVIFMVCLATLMVEVWLLLRVGPRGRFRFEELSLPRREAPLASPSLSRPGWSALAIVALAAVAAKAGVAALQGSESAPVASLREFPLVLDEWRGRPDQIDPDVYAALNLSDYFLGDYLAEGDGVPVNFYVAFYAAQKFGASSHSPSNCIPGGGWRILSSEIRRLPVAWIDDHPLEVSRIVIQKGADRALVYYWFDERGRDLTEVTSVKWHLLLDSLRLHRTDGALIRVVSPITGPGGEAAAERRMDAFVARANPALAQHLPAPPAL